MTNVRTLPAIALACMLAACANGTSGGSLPSAAGPSAARVEPNAACPVPGKVYTVGKASALLESKVALTRLPALPFDWTVVFKNPPKKTAPFDFVPKLFACGTAAKPLGTVRLVKIVTGPYHCTNGVCTLTEFYRMEFKPPAKLPGNKPWKFVLLKYALPPKAPPGYGIMNGARIEIKP